MLCFWASGAAEKNRKTRRHTLLRLYMEILRELNTIALSPFDLSKYDDMPRLVGNYRVRRHDSFITTSEVDNSSLVRKQHRDR
jgi:hypothetical protein